MTPALPPVPALLPLCPTCSFQQGGNPGAEFFLYMMLAMPWIVMATVGAYFYVMRRRNTVLPSGTDPAPPSAAGPQGPPSASAATPR